MSPFRTVRFRLTAATVLILAVAVLVVSVALLISVRRTLIDEIDAAIGARADDLAARIVAEGTIGDVGFGTDFGTLAVLIDADDSLLATTDSTADPDALLDSVADGDTITFYEPRTVSLPDLDETEGSERMRAVVADADDDGESNDVLVFAATSLQGVDDTVDQLRTGLLIGGPLIVTVAGALAWMTAGRALRPVDRMRREVETITADDLHRRLTPPDRDDEIALLAATMNSLLDRVDASQRSLSQFVSDAAHELRTPLAAVAAHLDVDDAHPEETDPAATRRVVRHHTERLQHIVSDLLLLARADSDRLIGREGRQSVDFGDVVIEAAHSVNRPDGIDLEATAIAVGATVVGDGAELGRIVTNLVANAVAHASTRVTVTLEHGAVAHTLCVDDDGPGVPYVDRDRVFERFVRLDDSRVRDRGGTGLGLAIVAELVSAHGGSVAIDDSPAGGARVTVRLPAG